MKNMKKMMDMKKIMTITAIRTGVSMHKWMVTLLSAVACVFGTFGVVGSVAATEAVGKTCYLPGHKLPLRCLEVPVPRDYAHPERGQIKIHVIVAPAFRENAKPDSVYVLAGGPGQSGSSIAALLDMSFHRIRATRDIVIIDQRGTGRSGKLSCSKIERSDTEDREQAHQELAACLQSLKVDFNDYSTEAAARDIDQVRLALKGDKINLWGASYGTRLAQAYARQFPASVRSMVLDGVVAPEQNIAMLNMEAQRALEQLRQQCEQDKACRTAFPQFNAQLDALVARAASGKELVSYQHPLTGKTFQRPLELDDVVSPIHSLLYAPQRAVRLPWLIMQAAQGNWQPWAAQGYSSGGLDVASGLYFAVVCAEDWPYLSADATQAAQTNSFMRDSLIKRLTRSCPLVQVKPRPRAPAGQLQTPTLLLSGQRDPVTPPQRAVEALRLLPNGQHVIAAQLGHGVSHTGCGPKLLRQFYDEPGKKVDGKCFDILPAASFVMSAAGAQP
jgi:pimeloyl-ACP methyl ester carboxylesterase